jgi:hypothetical protein
MILYYVVKALLVQVGVKECLYAPVANFPTRIDKVLERVNVPLILKKPGNAFQYIVHIFTILS